MSIVNFRVHRCHDYESRRRRAHRLKVNEGRKIAVTLISRLHTEASGGFGSLPDFELCGRLWC
jgi:hypothetical protein